MIIFMLFSVIKIILIPICKSFLYKELLIWKNIFITNFWNIYCNHAVHNFLFVYIICVCVCLCAFKNSSIKSVWFTDEKCLHSFDVYCSFFSPSVMYYALFSNVCLFVQCVYPQRIPPPPHLSPLPFKMKVCVLDSNFLSCSQ